MKSPNTQDQYTYYLGVRAVTSLHNLTIPYFLSPFGFVVSFDNFVVIYTNYVAIENAMA